MIKNFLQELRTQRWDDHRYYHHSRINQSLHFVSAASFLIGYVMIFFDPVAAALIGWLVSMTTRQAGHFFFEPKGYDHVNDATHQHKEEIKVGYNLQRKVVLMTIWALSPLASFGSEGSASWRGERFTLMVSRRPSARAVPCLQLTARLGACS